MFWTLCVEIVFCNRVLLWCVAIAHVVGVGGGCNQKLVPKIGGGVGGVFVSRNCRDTVYQEIATMIGTKLKCYQCYPYNSTRSSVVSLSHGHEGDESDESDEGHAGNFFFRGKMERGVGAGGMEKTKNFVKAP